MRERAYQSQSEEETFEIAERLGKDCKGGEIFLLNGDLGVGKTVFSKGLGKGLGITEPIVSPTFTILQIYEEGRLPFYHFDVYRISDISDMDEIGYEDYFSSSGVCLIEWAELIRDILPDRCISVTIEKELSKGESYRNIRICRYE